MVLGAFFTMGIQEDQLNKLKDINKNIKDVEDNQLIIIQAINDSNDSLEAINWASGFFTSIFLFIAIFAAFRKDFI